MPDSGRNYAGNFVKNIIMRCLGSQINTVINGNSRFTTDKRMRDSGCTEQYPRGAAMQTEKLEGHF
jgi:hypothetical protein